MSENFFERFHKLSEEGKIHKLTGLATGYRTNKDINYGYFELDGTSYLIEEDPNDGYRSSVAFFGESDGVKPPRFKRPYFVIVKELQDELFILEELKSHREVLRLGTDNSDSWYPCYQFDFHPLPEDEMASFADFGGTIKCIKLDDRARKNALCSIYEMYEYIRDNRYLEENALEEKLNKLENVVDYMKEQLRGK